MKKKDLVKLVGELESENSKLKLDVENNNFVLEEKDRIIKVLNERIVKLDNENNRFILCLQKYVEIFADHKKLNDTIKPLSFVEKVTILPQLIRAVKFKSDSFDRLNDEIKSLKKEINKYQLFFDDETKDMPKNIFDSELLDKFLDNEKK